MGVLAPARAIDNFAAEFCAPDPNDIPVVTATAYALTGTETLIRETRSSTNGPADLAGDTHFRYDGSIAWPAHPSFPSGYVYTPLLTGGSSQAAYYQGRVSTVTSAMRVVKIKIRPAATSLRFRIRVNGRWVTQELLTVTGLSAGQGTLLVLTFPTVAARTITFECSGNQGFGGMVVPTGGTLTRPGTPSRPLRLAGLGDSYMGGASNPPDGAGRMETFINYVARLIEATEFINFGIGGTGHRATAQNYITRIADIVTYAPDVVIVSGSRNDGADGSNGTGDAGAGLTTAVNAELDALHAGLPATSRIFYTGPSTTGFAANNTILKAAVQAWAAAHTSRQCYFIDGLAAGDNWISNGDLGTDGIHPKFYGHQRIGRRLAAAIKATNIIIPAPTPGPTAGDDFERDDTTAGLGVASIGGSTWTATGGGTAGIDTLAGYVYNSTVSVAYRNLPGGATGTWDLYVKTVGTGKNPRMHLNYSGGNDHIRIYGNGTHWFMDIRVTSVTTVTVDLGVTPANGDHVRVRRAADNTLTIWINDMTTSVYSSVITANATGTTFGLHGSNANTDNRYETITYTPLAA